MAFNVLMPQMGESVAEGTIVRWLKKVGDSVDRDEPIFEITTDKVDAEIPASEAGTLLEIRVQEGETVDVGAIVAVLGDANDVVDARQLNTNNHYVGTAELNGTTFDHYNNAGADLFVEQGITIL